MRAFHIVTGLNGSKHACHCERGVDHDHMEMWEYIVKLFEQPTCRECKEGKHGACDGKTWTETGDDEIVNVLCVCDLNGHYQSQD